MPKTNNRSQTSTKNRICAIAIWQNKMNSITQPHSRFYSSCTWKNYSLSHIKIRKISRKKTLPWQSECKFADVNEEFSVNISQIQQKTSTLLAKNVRLPWKFAKYCRRLSTGTTKHKALSKIRYLPKIRRIKALKGLQLL